MTGPTPSDQRASPTALERLDSVIAGGGEYRGRGDRSAVTVTSNFGLRVEEGSWRIEADLSEAMGGIEPAPTLGMVGRAALGSCIAIGYQLSAADLDVELTWVRVEIETDSGFGHKPSTAQTGFGGVRYHATIESSERAERVQAVIDRADRLSPYPSGFASATLRRTISINRPSK